MEVMGYFVALAIAVGFGTALAAVGGSLGQGYAIRGAMEGVARQPEAGGRILTMMIIGLALIESLTIYALLLGFQLLARLPQTDQLIQALTAAGGAQ